MAGDALRQQSAICCSGGNKGRAQRGTDWPDPQQTDNTTFSTHGVLLDTVAVSFPVERLYFVLPFLSLLEL